MGRGYLYSSLITPHSSLAWMRISFNGVERLRRQKGLDLAALFAAFGELLQTGEANLRGIHLTCDWVQYRANFRPPVAARCLWDADAERLRGHELALDLRQLQPERIRTELGSVLAGLCRGPAERGDLYLEAWGRGSESIVWGFNSLYWQALGHWEAASGQGYEAALPGGATDATNTAMVAESVAAFIERADLLAQHHALPEHLFVLEIGVGNGAQARAWLDEFRRQAAEHGGDYYRRLRYLMSDLSPYVLELAHAAVAEHTEQVSCLVLDASDPLRALSFLRYKVLLVYISNVYDNLPTDELVRAGGRPYAVQARAYLPESDAVGLAEACGVPLPELATLAQRLVRLGPELLPELAPLAFPDVMHAVAFWRDLWGALKQEERYVALEDLGLCRIAPGVDGSHLEPLLAGVEGDLRCHLSNTVVASFVNTLPLLHPAGTFQVHDLFVTDLDQYQDGFRGPGKYEGSVVNWINGPLLREIARRYGYRVDFAPFAYRAKSNVVTLTTSLIE